MRFFSVYVIASVLLHFGWEHLHAPLYTEYVSFSQFLPLSLWVTCTGDLFMMLLLYLVLAVVHREVLWIEKREVFSHPATWVLPPFVGMLFATLIELRALVDHRWSYSDAMPILPFFPVGLTPVLQMIVVPLVTLGLCFWLLTRAATPQVPKT